MLVLLTFGCSLFTGTATPPPTLPAEATVPAEPQPTTEAPTATPIPSPTAAVPLPAPTTESATATAVTQLTGLDLDMLMNFTYILEYSPNNLVPLTNGIYDLVSSDPNEKLHSELFEPAAFGDLNGDGVGDAAVNIVSETGGTGHFFNLVAVLSTNQGPVQAAQIFVDDRARLNDLNIADGKIVMDVVRHGTNDPGCCPNMHVIQTYELHGTTLELVNEEIVP